MQRREFITKTTALGATAALLPDTLFSRNVEEKKVRLAIIGVGERGSYLIKEAVSQGGAEAVAICDIDPAAIARTKEKIKKYQSREVAVYSGERDFEKIVQRDDIDAVLIATPWQWHTPMALAALKAGKPTGCEVPVALTVKDCWALVDAVEKTGVPLMMMENVCYRRDVMAVLNMARQGLFGRVTYAECGYQHDLREVLFNDGKTAHGKGLEFGEKAYSEARWRTQHHVDRNGELYPTHGIGPVAQVFNINHGNQFSHLTSMATPALSLHEYLVEKGGPEHPNAKVNFKCGDVVTTLIKCTNGEVVKMTHDVSSPRPYSLGFRIQGTQGIWTEDAKGIYLQKKAPKPHEYEPAQKYFDEYDHPLWKNLGKEAQGAGHGGMDYFVIRSFVESVRRKMPFPQDVYDAAAWSVIGPLSEASIDKGSKPMDIPDFTRGKWKSRPALFAMGDV
ncbi:MAG: Gfo/Idh/MocA family oxidoreductase [Cytophagaceae bacterium]|nr:Gfo/Idh/MocA family oxidoreductase [Cytophagaceae bacterium]